MSWHIAMKSLGALVTLLIITRILGKKQISQLTFFEYVTGITIGDLAGTLSLDMETNFREGITAIMVWAAVPFLIEYATLKSKTMRRWLEGRQTIVVKNGSVIEANLRRERYSVDELLSQLRAKNVFQIEDVLLAALEANGDLTVQLMKDKQLATVGDLERLQGGSAGVKESRTNGDIQ